jgi:hypothetical protein
LWCLSWPFLLCFFSTPPSTPSAAACPFFPRAPFLPPAFPAPSSPAAAVTAAALASARSRFPSFFPVLRCFCLRDLLPAPSVAASATASSCFCMRATRSACVSPSFLSSYSSNTVNFLRGQFILLYIQPLSKMGVAVQLTGLSMV